MSVRTATSSDVSAMVALVTERRAMMNNADPSMFALADNAPELSEQFFAVLVDLEEAVCLVWDEAGTVEGVAIALRFTPPLVYAPKGAVYMLDDLAISSRASWEAEGALLIAEIETRVKDRDAGSLIAVCPACDEGASAALETAGLYTVSRWWRKALNG